MIQEVIYALAGHPGDLVVEAEDGFVVGASVDFLTEAERLLVEQTVRAGFHCRCLSRYTEEVTARFGRLCDETVGSPNRVDGTAASPTFQSAGGDGGEPADSGGVGHYVYAMALCIEDALDEYLSRVVDLEEQVMRETSMPLAHLAAAVEEDRRALAVVHRLVDRVQADCLQGGPLLNVLWTVASSHVGSGSVGTFLWNLVSGVGQALANQLVGWVVYGRLVDPFGEFFIRRANDQRPPWRSGSSWCGGPVDDFSREADAACARREWQSAFFMSTEAVPFNIISFSTARKALFVGKAVRVLIRSGRWLPIAGNASGVGDIRGASVSALDPPSVQAEVDELRRCFNAKSPAFVVERSIERIRASVASQLRELLVQEAALAEHLAALKGFYLLGHGAFYQTFLEEALPLLQRSPPPYAENELQHGPWRAAMNERETAADVVPDARFTVRFVPRSFEFLSFVEAARQVKLMGLARLAGGHAELGLGQSGTTSSSSAATGSVPSTGPSPSMMWLAARQRISCSFDHAFSFQVHAPPCTQAQLKMGSQGDYGSRFALCFQDRFTPSELQKWRAQTDVRPGGGGSDVGGALAPARCHTWSSLVECLALEVTYYVLPLGPGSSAAPVAEVSFSLYLLHPSLCDGQRPQADASMAAAPVKLLASSKLTVPAPRSAVHFVRLWHDAHDRRLKVFLGTDAVTPACSAELELKSSLSLDLGCAYMGFCSVPLDHRHRLVGGGSDVPVGIARLTAAKSAARDRPVSIVSWRHRTRPTAAADERGPMQPPAEALGTDAWFACMELSYDAPWPLPLIITQECLETYNQLFRLLFSFRHTHLELQRVAPPRGEIFPWAFRAQLSYFVLQVLLYFQQDVIEVAYQQLQASLEAGRDFDDIFGAHETFLAVVTVNCFLRVPDLQGALASALRVASAFCRLRFSGASAAGASQAALDAAAAARAAELRRLQAEFSRAVESVLRMMTSMQKEGVHALVSQLLLRLDYNGYFSGQTLD